MFRQEIGGIILINQQITINRLKEIIQEYNNMSIVCNILDGFNNCKIENNNIYLHNSAPDTITSTCTHLTIKDIVSLTIDFMCYYKSGAEIHVIVLTDTQRYKLLFLLNNS